MEDLNWSLLLWVFLATPALVASQFGAGAFRDLRRQLPPQPCPNVRPRSPSPGCYMIPIRDPSNSCVIDFRERCDTGSRRISLLPNRRAIPNPGPIFSHDRRKPAVAFPTPLPLFPSAGPQLPRVPFNPGPASLLQNRPQLQKFKSLRPDDPKIEAAASLTLFPVEDETPVAAPNFGRSETPQEAEESCPVVNPPSPKPGCYWIPIRSPTSGCLLHYGEKCRPVATPCTPLAGPSFRPGCSWVTLNDKNGCISSFRCEPARCSTTTEPAAQEGCTWFPVRDNDGCTISHQCLPEPTTLKCPVPDKPTNRNCNLVGDTDGRGCILQFRCEHDPAPPKPLVPRCSPVAQPEVEPGCYNEPVKDVRTGCVVRFQTKCPTRKPVNCPFVPPPAVSPHCNLVSIHDVQGCIVKFECEPVHCPEITPPIHRPGCTWISKRDADGCTTAFECAAKNPNEEKCPNEPEAPDTTGVCNWTPIRNEEGCITDYQCDLSPKDPTRIGVTLPPPQPRSRKQPLSRLPNIPPHLRASINQFRRTGGSKTAPAQLSRNPFGFSFNPRPGLVSSDVFPTFNSLFGPTLPTSPRIVPEGCPDPPQAPDNGGFCEWAPLTDPKGCIVNYECLPPGSRRNPPPKTPKAPEKATPTPHIPLPPRTIPFVRPNAQQFFPETRTRSGRSCPPEPVKPRDTSYCKWKAQKDDKDCIIRYKCKRTVKPQECPPAPLKPDDSLGCTWTPVPNAKGCIVDFQCEPGSGGPDIPEAVYPCPPEPSRPADTRRCRYIPLRDPQGCVVNYHCDVKVGATARPKPSTKAPTEKPRSREVERVSLPPPLEGGIRPIQGPYKPIERSRAPYRPQRRDCPPGPIRPEDTPGCNWIDIFDLKGCLISYRCEPHITDEKPNGRNKTGFGARRGPQRTRPVTRPPRRPDPFAPRPDCGSEPVSPANSDRCIWVSIKDSRGCVIDFECEPVQPPTTTRAPCPKKPKKPRTTKKCDWVPVRNRYGCLIDYRCDRLCQDKAPQCHIWAQIGLCFRHPGQMANLCPESCGNC